MKAVQNQGQVKKIKKYTFDDKDSPLISKQKEIFNKLADKRLDDITEFDKKIDLDDLIYIGKTPDENFNIYDNAFDIKLAEVKNYQIRFKSNLGKMKKGNNKKRSKEQTNALYNIDMLYKPRNEAIKLFDDYSSMVSEAKNKAKN